MFILFGPNSAPVAGSIVHVFEGATAYIAKCIKKIQQEYLKSMVVSLVLSSIALIRCFNGLYLFIREQMAKGELNRLQGQCHRRVDETRRLLCQQDRPFCDSKFFQFDYPTEKLNWVFLLVPNVV